MIAMIITSVLLMVSAPAVDVSGGGALFSHRKAAVSQPHESAIFHHHP